MKKTLSVWISNNLIDVLNDVAIEMKTSKSKVVEHCLNEYLKFKFWDAEHQSK